VVVGLARLAPSSEFRVLSVPRPRPRPRGSAGPSWLYKLLRAPVDKQAVGCALCIIYALCALPGAPTYMYMYRARACTFFSKRPLALYNIQCAVESLCA
jgi:hypothetical protein